MKQRHTTVWSPADGRYGGEETSSAAYCDQGETVVPYRSARGWPLRGVGNARATAILRLPCKTGIPSHETRPHSHATSV